MKKKNRKRYSISEEPHIARTGGTQDPSEARAREGLQSESARLDQAEQRARYSVFNEPSVLPNRPPVTIERDWLCRQCGYNLRGLQTGQDCPECGKPTWYEPPRQGEMDYPTFLAQQRHRLARRRYPWAVGAIFLVSLPLALINTVLCVDYAGVVAFAMIGPLLSEILRVLPTWMVVERHSYVLRSGRDVVILALVTTLIFAAVQNLLYVLVFFKTYGANYVAYRWSVGTAGHLVCGLIAVRGLRQVVSDALLGGTMPRLHPARSMVVVAAVLHGSWNAIIFLTGKLGYGF